MKNKMATSLALGIGILAMTSGAFARNKITIAYFMEWPTPNQVAQIEKTFDKELDADVEWRAFGNGNEMTQAMVSGAVQIAYSVGFPAFVVGVSNGAPVKAVGIAVSYADNDLCIARNDSGITKETAKQLEGKKVATPIGNVTHYNLMETLKHLGVDSSKVEFVQMNPSDAAVALIRGDVPMACGFGGALDRMKEVGTPLLTGAEKEAAGIHAFDIVQASDDVIKNHPEWVRKFLAVTDKANADFKASPDKYYDTIAKAAGMDVEATKKAMAAFTFPSNEEQAGPQWLGGGLQKSAKGIADLMKASGNMETTLDDYSSFIDSSFLK